MANDLTTSSGLAPEIKQYYDMVLLTRATPNLMHLQFGQRRPLPRNGGKSVEFRRFNSMPEATTALTEGTASNQQNASVSNVVASINQYGSYVVFSDLLLTTALDGYLAEVSDVLAEQAGSTIDIVTRNVLTAGTNVQFAGAVASRGAVTASSIMTATEIRKASRTLKRANARPFDWLGNTFALVLHPDVMFDVLADSTITNVYRNGTPRDVEGQPELIGYVTQFMGMSLFETTNARVFASAGATGADVYASLAIARDAYGVTEVDADGLQSYYKEVGSAGSADPLNQQGSLGWKVNYACEILNQSWMVRLETGATP